MKFIWYISNILVVVLVLLSNPQAGNLGNQTKIINSTRSSQQGLQLVITFSIMIFFLCTIYFSINQDVM